ncbi:hypothetical protein [Kitasatospora sp. NPDC050543]|uniref:hypothetical protein n=1 Tax=Kitasatospora sp. NPDC050543 TaxID=3364054 RepID=UPI00378AFDE5
MCPTSPPHSDTAPPPRAPLSRRTTWCSASPTGNRCAHNASWTACASSQLKADVPIIAVHDLSHLAATLPITAGVPLTTVSKRLRHATLSTTANIYDHLTHQAARDAADTIADILARADKDATHQRWFHRLQPHRDHSSRRQEHPASPKLPAIAAA